MFIGFTIYKPYLRCRHHVVLDYHETLYIIIYYPILLSIIILIYNKNKEESRKNTKHHKRWRK